MTNEQRYVLTTSVRFTKMFDEYRVRAWDQHGKRFIEADHFTNDKEDADNTAALMATEGLAKLEASEDSGYNDPAMLLEDASDKLTAHDYVDGTALLASYFGHRIRGGHQPKKVGKAGKDGDESAMILLRHIGFVAGQRGTLLEPVRCTNAGR
tara:strand:+ start:4961 stop:5419 length:459 start_codon:yes stop_codon:yes gene_type:complete